MVELERAMHWRIAFTRGLNMCEDYCVHDPQWKHDSLDEDIYELQAKIVKLRRQIARSKTIWGVPE